MKRLLVILLMLALCLAPASFAEGEKSYTLVAECFDWGEAITTIEIEGLKGEYAPGDFSVSATVTYFSYATYSTVTEEAVREVTAVETKADKTVLKLAAPFGDTVKAYPDSAANYAVSVKGEKITACKGLVNAAIDAFKEGECADVNYRLFVPQTDTPAPLVLWLHGGGEGGRDNRLQISANMVTNWITPESQKCFGAGGAYILAPQYNETTNAHNPEAIKAILDEVIAQYNVDEKRLYVGGCSMGGMGTHDMLTAYPALFAAAFPICPASTLTAEAAAALAKSGVKVHYTHSIDDTTCGVTSSLVSAQLLKDAGADAHMTLFDRVRCDGLPTEMADMLGHWSWTYVHRNYDCAGDDYDGQNYHPGAYVGQIATQYYDGELFDMANVDVLAEGFTYFDDSTWTYNGAPYDKEKVTYTYQDVPGTSVTPLELGCPTLFDWLAAQSR